MSYLNFELSFDRSGHIATEGTVSERTTLVDYLSAMEQALASVDEFGWTRTVERRIVPHAKIGYSGDARPLHPSQLLARVVNLEWDSPDVLVTPATRPLTSDKLETGGIVHTGTDITAIRYDCPEFYTGYYPPDGRAITGFRLVDDSEQPLLWEQHPIHGFLAAVHTTGNKGSISAVTDRVLEFARQKLGGTI